MSPSPDWLMVWFILCGVERQEQFILIKIVIITGPIGHWLVFGWLLSLLQIVMVK